MSQEIKTYQIVLDTNVLFAGLRSQRGASYKLLTILNDIRWQLNISTALLFEYEEILKRQQAQLGLSLEDIDDVIEAICSIANKRSIFYLWRPILNDPDDDFLHLFSRRISSRLYHYLQSKRFTTR